MDTCKKTHKTLIFTSRSAMIFIYWILTNNNVNGIGCLNEYRIKLDFDKRALKLCKIFLLLQCRAGKFLKFASYMSDHSMSLLVRIQLFSQWQGVKALVRLYKSAVSPEPSLLVHIGVGEGSDTKIRPVALLNSCTC